MNSLKQTFYGVALTLGTAATMITGASVVFGNWDTSSQMGGVNMSPLGIGLTLVFGGVAFLGARGLIKNAPQNDQKTETAQKPDPKP